MTSPIAAISLAAPEAVRTMTGASPAAAPGTGFADALKSAMANTVQSVAASENQALAAVNGKASLQDVVQATINAEIAVETAISVRNKVIEGYQDIIRMPV